MTRVTYSAISSFSRVRILSLLQERPERTVVELCEATGLHANTVREHLQRLREGGYVVAETEHRRTRGRPRVLYSAATGADAEYTSAVAKQKAEEAARRGDLMRRVLPWTNVDELPARAVHQIDALVEDLADAGFDHDVDERELSVTLTPCPHASASARDRETLCAVHLALMDGVLTQADGPLRVQGMRACDSASECVVQLLLRERAHEGEADYSRPTLSPTLMPVAVA